MNRPTTQESMAFAMLTLGFIVGVIVGAIMAVCVVGIVWALVI